MVLKIVERFADNGKHSHNALIEANTGKLLWSEYPEEETDRSLCWKQNELINRSNKLNVALLGLINTLDKLDRDDRVEAETYNILLYIIKDVAHHTDKLEELLKGGD